MGSADDDKMAWSDERPQHRNESITDAYWISRYPITNDQFAVFVEAGGYKERRHWTDAGWKWKEKAKATSPYAFGEPFNLSNHPVVGVSWYEVVAYCRWLTEQSRLPDFKFRVWRDGEIEVVDARPTVVAIRLPSEAEWEKAARGEDGRRYPWGAEPDTDKANYDDTGIGATSAVGCFPGGASPYGVEDLSGNVWEWCATKWEDDYQDYTGDNSPEGEGRRVLRGGAFYDGSRFVRCAFRYRPQANLRGYFIGFRVVVSPVL